MKILIKGAGDLATGIASRLYSCGHQIIMTEIPVPLTVRRSVALSRAVYEQTARVENMTGVLVKNMEEAERVHQRGDIAIVVDPEAQILQSYQPEVLIDAILAKKNIGTHLTDAPFVIGIGPGFTAGEDCHCVVETKRGHTLGKIIWKGCPIPNTGVPGNVGGYTIERLIRASAAGEMKPVAAIGDTVSQGEVVAYTGGEPVYALMSGIVRGMLQEGALVTENLKIGDIDARCEESHCFTISDKARAIGGGVLDAVGQYEKMKGNYAIIVLAAGAGKRFGGRKLEATVKGKALYQHMLDKVKGLGGFPCYLVTGTEQIRKAAGEQGLHIVDNTEPERGISHSLRLGLTRCLAEYPNIQGVLFAVCDQPNVSFSLLYALLREGFLHPNRIVCAGHQGKYGNPVFWDRAYFPELLALTGDVGGRAVMNRRKEDVLILEAEAEELKDIDRREDIGE